jgi:cyclophilin family peptidyl-prolyl cis-trans isomerase/HEAT repeat protein
MAMIPLPLPKATLIALISGLLVSGCVPDPGRESRVEAAYLRLLAAEDARAATAADLQVLLDGTASTEASLRRVAVRALGRLENPEMVDHIVPLLMDPAATVRESTANAIAQAFHTSPGDEALPILVGRISEEHDPSVRGTLAHSIGRLRLTPASRREAEIHLVELSRDGNSNAPSTTLVGVALGLEALVRGAGGDGLGGRAAERLDALTTYSDPRPAHPDAVRIRTLAVSSLGQSRRMNRARIIQALSDEAPDVRAMGARHLDAVPPSRRADLIRSALSDSFPQTPLEGLRHLAQLPRDERYCSYLLAAAEPSVLPGIRVVALDALARACPDAAPQRDLLRQAAGELASAEPGLWQPSAHALVSLTRISPDDATAALPVFVDHSNPFVRAYAARAAGELGNRSVLRTLALDDEPNVRSAAITGLFALEGHRIDDVLVAQFDADDPQLLMTSARLLEGAANSGPAASAALSAFERISAAERETWRDARLALVARIAELGASDLTERLIPYLSDYDPLVAEDVAAALEGWNGRPYAALPRPLDRMPLPTTPELAEMVGASVLLHMQTGGTIEIELHPHLATTNVFRFVRLVRAGHFDGLTFHRWEPNFVIQGGSPGANEYYGDGPFSRDEVGLLPHWRGTVGISTRGHDTGDGQLFVNLIDNVRLDHSYTIVGTVVSGMGVVDSVLEGGVIERAEFRPSVR